MVCQSCCPWWCPRIPLAPCAVARMALRQLGSPLNTYCAEMTGMCRIPGRQLSPRSTTWCSPHALILRTLPHSFRGAACTTGSEPIWARVAGLAAMRGFRGRCDGIERLMPRARGCGLTDAWVLVGGRIQLVVACKEGVHYRHITGMARNGQPGIRATTS